MFRTSHKNYIRLQNRAKLNQNPMEPWVPSAGLVVELLLEQVLHVGRHPLLELPAGAWRFMGSYKWGYK